jgi:Family of unknown function (DUF5522)
MDKTLIENEDYYIEKGRWVFTATFLQKRGYCCGSGCRHCPYKEKKVIIASTLGKGEIF